MTQRVSVYSGFTAKLKSGPRRQFGPRRSPERFWCFHRVIGPIQLYGNTDLQIWDAPGSKLATWPTATFALYTDTHCVTALHSYTTLYSAIHYTAIQLYSAIHSTTSTTPLCLVRARSTTNICRARGSDPSTSCRTSAFGPLLRLEQHGRRALGPARDFPSLIRPSPLVHFSFYNSSLTSPNLANRHSDEPLPCSAFIYALQRL